MKDQNQIDQMRAAIQAGRERALARMRADGREPVFPHEDEVAEPVSEQRPEELPTDVQAQAEEPAAELPTAEEPVFEPSFLTRLRDLFRPR